MAQVPFSPTASVAPQSAAPSDYQRIDASPAAFGAMQGAAEQQAAQRTQQGANDIEDAVIAQQTRYNQVAADDAMNNLQSQYHKLTFDGYYNLRGADAMRAYDSTKQSLDDARQKIRDGLHNDVQKLQFDQDSRRMQLITMDGVGRHYNDQFVQYQAGVAQATENVSLQGIASQYNDDGAFLNGLEDARRGAVRAAQARFGNAPDPKLITSEVSRVTSSAIKTRVQAWAPSDPTGAANWLANGRLPDGAPIRSALSAPDYDAMVRLTKVHAETQNVSGAIERAFTGATGSPVPLVPNPVVPQTIKAEAPKYGLDPIVPMAFAVAESRVGTDADKPGNSHVGVFQMGPNEWREAGGTDANRADPTAQAKVGTAWVAQDMRAATAVLGRPAQGWEGYVVHVNGVAGGRALLTADPNANAVQALSGVMGGFGAATKAIEDNGGNADMSVGQWLGMMQGRYGRAQLIAQQMSGGTDGTAPAIPQASDRMGQAMDVFRRAEQETAGLPSDQRERVMNGVFTRIQRTWALEDRAHASEQKQRQQVVEDATHTFVQQLVTDPTKADIHAFDHLPIKAEELWHLHQMQQSAIMQDMNAGQAKTYGAGFYKLYQAVHAAPGDPNRITDPSALYSHVGPGGDLTVSGVDKLTQEIIGRRTPEGEAESKLRQTLFQAARQEILHDDPLTGMKDPKGSERFLGFMASAYGQIQKLKAAGKTVGDIYDPKSPDYVGKMIKAFVRTPAQVQADLAAENGILPGAPTQAKQSGGGFFPDWSAVTPPKADMTTKDGIVQAYRAGQITREEAGAALVKGGFAIAPAPTAPEVPH